MAEDPQQIEKINEYAKTILAIDKLQTKAFMQQKEAGINDPFESTFKKYVKDYSFTFKMMAVGFVPLFTILGAYFSLEYSIKQEFKEAEDARQVIVKQIDPTNPDALAYKMNDLIKLCNQNIVQEAEQSKQINDIDNSIRLLSANLAQIDRELTRLVDRYDKDKSTN